MANNKFIKVSGVADYLEDNLNTATTITGFPSGTVVGGGSSPTNSNINLLSFQANIGFNRNPNNYQFEFVAGSINNNNFPAVGTSVNTFVGGVKVEGIVTHSDFSKSINGNVVSISVEDNREILNNIVVDTFGVLGNAANISNLVDVRKYLRDKVGSDILTSDLEILEIEGASYDEIFGAIDQQAGDFSEKIPDPSIIADQLGGNIDGYRWQARGEPLLNLLARIFNDIALDFYWDGSRVQVVDKREAITISTLNHPILGDSDTEISRKFGQDRADRATKARVFGAQMEGILTTGNTGNAFVGDLNQGDLGVSIDGATWVPAWRNAFVRYFNKEGTLEEDRPTDRELAASLKGIEYWAFEKGLDNRIGNATTFNGEITVTSFNPTSASGLNLIPNRGSIESKWVIEWFNRVRTFASNFFGRAYFLQGVGNDQIRDFEVLPEAWSSLENRTDEGSFKDDYDISDAFNILAPFWNHSTNKLKAVAILSDGPQNPKWGIDGQAEPAQFPQYNEDQSFTYVPVEIRQWDTKQDQLTNEFLPDLGKKTGIIAILPQVCWADHEAEDNILKKSKALTAIKNRVSSHSTLDFINPLVLGEVKETIDGIIMPVRVKKRYGVDFPKVWEDGSGDDFKVEIFEDLAPWNFSPRGTETSVDLLADEGDAIVSSLVVNRNSITFAEVEKVGLPVLSLEGFSQEGSVGPSFEAGHGITNIQVSISAEGYKTRYGMRSAFPQVIKKKPIEPDVQEDFAFAIKRLRSAIEENESRRLKSRLRSFRAPVSVNSDTIDGRGSFIGITSRRSFQIPVIVTRVRARGSTTEEEHYVSRELGRDIIWPRGADPIIKTTADGITPKFAKASATDGFLQVGMFAVYNYEENDDGGFEHFFTGGVPLEAGKIVQMTESPRLLNNVWVANIQTLPTQVAVPSEFGGGDTQTVSPFKIFNVPFVNQANVDQTLQSGDKIAFISHGNKNKLEPNIDLAPGGENADDGFLYNVGAAATEVEFATVLTPPSATDGTGGKIQTIDNTGGVIYEDGKKTGDNIFNLFFTGTDPKNVEKDDFAFVKRFKELDADNEFRMFVFVHKPTFMGLDALAG